MITKVFRLLAFLPLVVFTSRAELQLPAIFGDNMVLQQGMDVPVWGWADDGDQVTVSFRGQKISTTAKDGKWSVKLHKLRLETPLGPERPDMMIVTSKGSTIQFTNVVVGEVWLCGGQSNMELALKKSFQPETDIASATNTLIRLCNIKNKRSQTPLTNVTAKWLVCSPETAADFSAVGYYFGRDLQAARGVPVGLLEADASGSPSESWTRKEILESNPRFKKEILNADAAAEEKFQQKQADFKAAKEVTEKGGGTFTNSAPRRSWRPFELYNGMIAPVASYGMKGVVWYQGESNIEKADQYRVLFPALIHDWRARWGEGNFPFICVQIAPYDKTRKRSLEEITRTPEEADSAELREVQRLTAKNMPKVGMVVIADIGEKDNIHPVHKEPVGQRLALAARAIGYGEKIEYAGPLYRSMKIRQGRVLLTFDHIGGGLVARDGELTGFAICGEDRKWVWARAKILSDNTVAVSSLEVPRPVAVRYGWADFPVVNLRNANGLPASPFRTDDFLLTTAPK